MAEENQVTKEPQEVQQEQQLVTMKDPKKVEAGKRLAAINHKKREVKKRKAKKREEQAQLERTTGWGFTSRINQYYGIRAVIAIGVIGGLGYYIYRSKKGREVNMPNNPTISQPLPRPQTNKFEMD